MIQKWSMSSEHCWFNPKYCFQINVGINCGGPVLIDLAWSPGVCILMNSIPSHSSPGHVKILFWRTLCRKDHNSTSQPSQPSFFFHLNIVITRLFVIEFQSYNICFPSPWPFPVTNVPGSLLPYLLSASGAEILFFSLSFFHFFPF